MSKPNPDEFFGSATQAGTESVKKKRPNPDDYFGAVKPPKPPEPTTGEKVAAAARQGLEVAKQGLAAARKVDDAIGDGYRAAASTVADSVRGLGGMAADAWRSMTSDAPAASVLEQPAPAGAVQPPQGGLTPQEMAAGEVSPEAQARRDAVAAYQSSARAPEARPEGLGERIGQTIREATSSPVARGLAAGFGGLAQTGIGLVRAGADAVGADEVANFAGDASGLANATSDGAMRDLKGNDKLVADVFNSIAVSSPMLAAAVSGGGALPLLFGQSALAEYNTGRNSGFSPRESAARAGIMATAEVLGEKFGLPQQVKLLKSLGNKVPTGELAHVASEMLLKDIPGEQLTTAMQFLGDKYGPAAQNPKASLQDYLSQAGDTLAVTIGQGAVMGGGPVAVGATRNAYAKADAALPFVATPRVVADLANKYGISPKAAGQMSAMLEGMEPAQANAFVEKALRGFEAKGLARKAGAAEEFKAMAQAAVEGGDGAQVPVDGRMGGIAPAADDGAGQPAGGPADAGGSPVALGDGPAQAEQPVREAVPAVPAAADTQPALSNAAADEMDAGSILGTPPAASAAPVISSPLDEAAHAAATSPTNDRAEPTDGQKQAGNYLVGRLKVAGMPISIENPQGSVRRGTDADGKPWETPLTAHYGYFSGTLGNDGDKLDTFVKQGLPQDWSGAAFVVDQIDPKTGKFDEHKVVLGADSEQEARDLYLANYSDGWQGLGAITRLPMPAFKAWAKSGRLKEPLGDIAAAPAAEGAAVQSTNPEKGAPNEVIQQPSLSPSAAQPAALAQPTAAPKPAKVRKHPDLVRGSGALAEVSKSLGGISPGLLSDLSQKTTRTRTSKTGKKTQFTTWDNPAIPGVGPLFRAGGTSDLTELARVLEEAGYIPAGTLERDYLEARNQAQDIIKAELSQGGSSLQVGEPAAVAAELHRRAERSATEPDPWWEAGIGLDDLQESGYLQADELTKQLTEQLVLQADGLGIDIDTIREDVARQVGDEATGNEYESAVQQAVQQAIDRSAGAAGQGDTRAEGPGGQDRGQAAEPPRRARGDGADRPDQAVQGQREELTLQAETEAQAQAKAEREQAALEAERKDKETEQARLKKTQADREARARADATVNHFELGQSADQQMTGQDDLFSATEKASHPNPAEGAKAAEAQKGEKKPSRKQTGKEAERELADYFTPGNIVKKYGGHDEVLAFKPGKDGAWSVQVQAVRKVDGQWVREGKPQDARWHSTTPDSRDLKAGPVERLDHASGKAVPYSEPRGDGKPFTNAPDRGVADTVIPHDGWRGDIIKTRDYAKRLVEAGKLDAEQVKAVLNDPDALASLIDAGTSQKQEPAAAPKTAAKARRPSSLKAEAGDSEKVRQAKADALRAIADIADILGKPTRLNIMPEEEQRLLPALTRLMDAAFTLGYLKFKEAARFTLDKLRELAGDEVANKVTLDHLQGAYIGMAGRHRDEGAERPAQVAAVESLDEITQNDPEGVDHVPSTDASVERGGRNAAAEQPTVGGPVRQEGGGVPAGVRADRERGGQADAGRDGDTGVHADGPTAAGKSGDQPLSGSDAGAEPAGRNAGVDDDPRGGGFGDGGIQSAAQPAGQAGNAVDPGTQLARKLKAQRDAESIPTVRGDADNIAATLPFLLPGQVEDVHKAETRFEQDDGYGMMFTNQPGTGKTFTGLGTVKRFSRQGKNNILILAPTDKVIDDWITSAAKLNLTVSKLPDTKSAGTGIVATTYANFGQNEALVTRAWDLVVPDESHYLMQEKDGDITDALRNLRAISLHPDGAYERAIRLHADLLARARELSDAASIGRKSDDERQWHEAKKLQAQADALYAQFNKAADDIKEYVASQQGKDRTRVLFLSATPFAYEKTIDYAQGYLFDYGDASGDGYNSGDGREQFFMQHFGYRMRYNKLTRPDANVDAGLMQRQFNSWLKSRGVLSSRMLDVEADYDRRFQLVESAIGARIDEALEWVSEQRRDAASSSGFSLLADALDKRFDFLSRRYLLEAIKAAEVVEHVRANLAAGRKVVVFHDYKKGGGFNPFKLSHVAEDGEGSDTELAADFNRALGEFHAQFPDLVRYPFETMPSPISLFQREFPGVLLFNGDVKPADRRAAVAKFQDDASGPQVILVQSAAGKEGISLHDTTGKHQRALFNLGLPTQPTTAIQQEGRIYRTGQVTDAIIRYLNTGTNWEKWAFATTIAQRASTTENLGLGEMARALKDGFIAAFEESGDFPVGHEGEGKGGKERDRAANNALSDYDCARSFYFGTQKKNSRTKAKEGADYFATPEPLGLKMVQWLDLRGGEDFAEPSAGHGAIARWAPENVNATAVEPSTTLRARLAMVFSGKIVPGDFESLHVGGNKFDGIAMNPPFGTAGRLAVDHLAKAAEHLRDGGRVAAILPDGPATEKKFDAWFYAQDDKGRQLHPELHLVATIKLPRVTFERAGTAVATRIVVIDKLAKDQPAPLQVNRDYSDIEDIGELFDRLENAELPKRTKPATPQPSEGEALAMRANDARQSAKAEKAQAQAQGAVTAADAGLQVVSHVTGKGKTIKGVIRTDLTKEQAQAIDPYTWRKDGGFFIRLEHLEKLLQEHPVSGARPVLSRTGKRPGDFVTFNGSSDLWSMPSDVAKRTQGRYTEAPVRLLIGEHRGKHRGFGLAHIEAEHGDEIRRLGLTPEEYVYRIVAGTTKVYDPGNGRLLLVNEKFGKHQAIVELRRDGNHYSVVSAFQRAPEGKVVWSGRSSAASLPSANAPSVTGQTAPDGTTPAVTSSADDSAVRDGSGAEDQPPKLPPSSRIAGQTDRSVAPDSSPEKAPGMPSDKLQAMVDRVTATWANAPAVRVAKGFADLPPEIQHALREQRADAEVRALYLPTTGEVWLLADRLKDEGDAQHALFHEVLGHFGLRGFLGTDYAEQMQLLQRANPALAKEAALWVRANGAAEIRARVAGGMSFHQAVQEVGLLAVEEALAERAEAGKPINLWGRIIAKLQQALRRIGLDAVANTLERMSQAETAALLANARKYVEGGVVNRAELGERMVLSSSYQAPARVVTPTNWTEAAKLLIEAGYRIERTTEGAPIVMRGKQEADFKAMPSHLRQAWNVLSVDDENGDWEADQPLLSRIAVPQGERQAAEILQGEPVAVLRGDEAPNTGFKALHEWAAKVFEEQFGGKAVNPLLGEVGLDQRSVRSSTGHKMTRHKASAFLAVKDVLEKGAVIAHGQEQELHSYYVSAPVVIGGVDDIVTVLVRRDANSNRMYVHSVATKKYLLEPQVSGADAQGAEQPSGKLTPADIRSVLNRLLSVKLDSQGGTPLLSRSPATAEQPQAGQDQPVVQADPADGRLALGSYKDRVQKALDRADRVVNGLGDLPDTDTFLAQRYRALGRIAQIDKIAGDIRTTFRKAMPSDKKEVYEYLTNADATTDRIADPEVARMSERVKRYINTVGDQLVVRGLLPESAREEYRDRYLPRMYLAHLLDEPSWRQIGAGKKVSNLGYLKKRKDIPQEIRDVLLGEVKDPAFLAANAIAKPMRDMALLDWLGQISQNEQWIHPRSMAEWAGQRVSAFWLKAEAKALRERAMRYPEEVNREKAMAVAEAMDAKALEALDGLQLDNADFKQMPDTPRYGRLRGLLVRREIYDDLMGSRDFVPDDPGWAQRLLGFGGVGTKVTQVWKMSKVSLNIPGQIRNMVSNAVMLQLSGVPLHRLPVLFARAMRQVRANGTHWQIAKKYGVTESTFSAQELYRARRDLLELERDIRGMSWLNAVKSLAAMVGDKAGDAYQFVEAVHKTVKIIDAMERQGLTEDKAALEAQKWLFDYSLVNRNVRYARNAPVGAPFVTFTAKVAPRLAEVALLHPQRFLPWVAMMYGLQAWAMSMFGGDDDEWEKLKHALPKWMQEKGHIAFLPFRDDAGRLQAADLSYFFPWSQWSELAMDMAHGDPLGAVKSLGVFSGPIPDLLTAIKTNEDAFTGRQIVNPGDPLPQRAASVLTYLYDMAAPPMISSNGVVSPMWLFGPEYGGKLAQAATGATNKLGDQKATVGQALIRLGGLNVYGIDPELTRAANLIGMRAELQQSQAALQSKLQNQGLTPEQQKTYIERYQAEMLKRAEELQKYAADSEVPEFAKRREPVN